ncbi:MAG: LysE family transporter [Bacteroidetes bacterium]|nr:LysE family transporter [Bacteroidota bacterium]
MLFLTFFIGLIANFIGYIPPGNINLSVVQLAINRGIKEVLKFLVAFSCAELIFTFGMMNAADWFTQQVKLDMVIDWVMVVLFGVLGTVTWMHRKKTPTTKKRSKGGTIRLGILLGFINPMQIPFWMVTGTYLITHQWIGKGIISLVVLSAGSAAGAFLCLFGYAKSAKYMKEKLDLSTRAINTGIAILFFAFAAYHIVKEVYIHFFKH